MLSSAAPVQFIVPFNKMFWLFLCKYDVQFVFTSICVVKVNILSMLFVLTCIQVYSCPTRFQYQTMFVSFNSITTGVTILAANTSGAPEFTSTFQWCSCGSIFSVICTILSFCLLVFVLFVFHLILRLLNTPLLSSNISMYKTIAHVNIHVPMYMQ